MSEISRIKNQSLEVFHEIVEDLKSEGLISSQIAAIIPKIESYLASFRADKALKSSITADLVNLTKDRGLLYVTGRFIERLAVGGIFDPEDFTELKNALLHDYENAQVNIYLLTFNTHIQLTRVMALLEKHSDDAEKNSLIERLLLSAEDTSELFAVRTNAIESLVLMSPNLSPEQRRFALARLSKIPAIPSIETQLNAALIALQASKNPK